ncbi:RNA polymerase II elongation factor ELL-like [Halichondria panicea]|uniref:RNA polymerase II elongation factor ELL-like n=1 Tax=Halichondria panicea TaxID=6063 RepID=UPI00312B8F33
MATLNLSDLKTGVAHPLENSQSSGKCLIHMKLTDQCTKSIDALVHSRKGAFFSLRFSVAGGTMVIPADDGKPCKFQFKTSSLQSRYEGQNMLECVHQAANGSYLHKLSCTGTIDHRLTVQGNDQIFQSTKDRMKQVEQKRKETMTQEIKLPTKGRAKKPKSTLKAPPPMDRTTPSPTFRKPVKHAPPKSTSSVGKSSVGGAGGGRMSSHTKLTAPVRVSLSLKERVIHFLAIKPQKRDEVLLKINKESKKMDTDVSAMLDAVLSEVSEVSSGNHKLRPEFYGDIQIEDWPQYNDAERHLVRRRYGKPSSVPSSSQSVSSASTIPSIKRGLLEPEPDIAPKKPKLEYPTTPAHKPHPLTISKDATKPLDPPQPSFKTPEPPKKKPKEKKKKKKHKPDEGAKLNSDPSTMTSDPSTVTSNPTSTTNDIPDFKMEFPPIQTDEQRTFYKEVFNSDYTEYIQLKDSMDSVSTPHQKLCSELSDKLKQLPKRCEEAKSIRKRIRAKYSEVQQNKVYQENRRRFQELHHKLDYIKKQVVDYDRTKQ